MINNYRFKNPSQISVELTSRCNLTCKHCINDSSMQQIIELPKETVFSIIDYMHQEGIVCFDISGGEPLMYPFLDDVLSYAATSNLTISLATNGIMLTKKIIEKLINTDVSVRISLDGANDNVNSILRGNGVFEQVNKNLQLCITMGLIPKISVVLHKKNINEFKKLVIYAYQIGIKKIQVMPLVLKGRASQLRSLALTKEQWKNFILSHKQLSDEYQIEISIDSPLQSIISQEYMPCVVGKFLAVIKPNGDVVPCSVLDVPLGNIFEQSLKDIWSSKIIDELNDTDKLKGKCAQCELKNKCSGGCRGIAYIKKGDYLCADPYCWKGNQSK